ncbi:FAD-dependent oxidoreductase [Inquilinus sp. KBS0705]|nr:FAD-dependent oxidoreductase [Inquilinus sp. KBS0705]
MKNTVIVIGAGAAGLMAAHALAKAGRKVIVLEARNRTGGRIYTISDNLFFKDTELGAEFVHGNLPVTLKLLKEAAIPYRSANAEMWTYRKGKFRENDMVIEDWELLIEKLDNLKQDTNIYDFLEKEFPGDKYAVLRNSVWQYVSGYDTGNPRLASAFALRKEWEHEEMDAQHRVDGGYCAIISYLVRQCKANGGEVLLNSVVKHISWKKGYVTVTTDNAETYEAAQVLIAMPLGVLQANGDEKGAISFYPAIPDHSKAIQQMGFGAVIKLLLEFKQPFWLDEESRKMAGDDIEKMGYLFSEEEIPTWWTQVPDQSNVLTGWIGGPTAADKLNTPDEEILAQGLQSLANIFKRGLEDLKGELIAYRIMNWTADPFTRGSYAYDTVEAPNARKVLQSSVEDTIYFAGEYLYEGTAMGTVEAALASGEEVANKILRK